MSQPVVSCVKEYPVHLDGCPITLIRCEEVEAKSNLKTITQMAKQALHPYPGKIGHFSFRYRVAHPINDDEGKVYSAIFQPKEVSLYTKFVVIQYKENKIKIELYTKELDAATFLIASGLALESVAQKEDLYRIIIPPQELKKGFKIFTRYNQIQNPQYSRLQKLIKNQGKKGKQIDFFSSFSFD